MKNERLLNARSVLFIIGSSFLLLTCGQTKTQEENTGLSFEKHQLWDGFFSEGSAVGDINGDGILDIVAGARWFEAPDWSVHEIWEPGTWDYTQGYSDSFLNFTLDINQDGWLDVICADFPGKAVYWYENPKGGKGHWKKYEIDSNICNESPMMVDVGNDGVMDLVFGNQERQQMSRFIPGLEGDSVVWERIAIGEEGLPGSEPFSHGLGFGDINGDKIKDIMVREGWWEAPSKPSEAPWTWHAAELGEPCSQMHSYDFDNDGDMDVVSSSAHEYGIWWYEQIRGRNDEMDFVAHLIDSTVSETHSLELTDMDLDGLPDLVTGKRYFSHQGNGPGGKEPPFLYWFRLQLDENSRPVWEKILIDDDSGVGIQVHTPDMNGDGKPDIVFANKKGVYYFEQN